MGSAWQEAAAWPLDWRRWADVPSVPDPSAAEVADFVPPRAQRVPPAAAFEGRSVRARLEEEWREFSATPWDRVRDGARLRCDLCQKSRWCWIYVLASAHPVEAPRT